MVSPAGQSRKGLDGEPEIRAGEGAVLCHPGVTSKT